MTELMRLTRSPWGLLDELTDWHDEFNRAFTFTNTGAPLRRSAFPPMNAWVSEEGAVVEAMLPGVDPKQVEIEVVGSELTLQGAINEVAPGEGTTVLRRERPSGRFTRVLEIPFRVARENVKASYRDGILRIELPKADEDKPRKIAVEAA